MAASIAPPNAALPISATQWPHLTATDDIEAVALRTWLDGWVLRLQQPRGGLTPDESYVLMELADAPLAATIVAPDGHELARALGDGRWTPTTPTAGRSRRDHRLDEHGRDAARRRREPVPYPSRRSRPCAMHPATCSASCSSNCACRCRGGISWSTRASNRRPCSAFSSCSGSPRRSSLPGGSRAGSIALRAPRPRGAAATFPIASRIARATSSAVFPRCSIAWRSIFAA